MTGLETPAGAAERWRYTGRRELRGGGLAHTWLDGTGTQYLFKGRGGGAIGATYDVTVNRGGGTVTLIGTPRFHSRVDDSARGHVAAWEAQDRAAYTNDTLRRAEARAKRDSHFGDLTLNQVRALMRQSPAQATALLAQIIRYLNK